MNNRFAKEDREFDKIMIEEGLPHYRVYSQYDYPSMGFTYIFTKIDDNLGSLILKTVSMPDSEQITINITELPESEKQLYLLRLAKIYDKKAPVVEPPKTNLDSEKYLADLRYHLEQYPMHFYDACVLDKETVEFAIGCILEREQQLKVIESVTNELNEANEILKTVNTRLKKFTEELEKIFGSHKKQLL